MLQTVVLEVLKQAIDACGVGFWIYDSNGWQFVSSSAAKIVGRNREELSSKTLVDILSTEHVEDAKNRIENLLSSPGKTDSVVYKVEKPDGKVGWIRLDEVCVDLDGRRVIGSFVYDATEEVRHKKGQELMLSIYDAVRRRKVSEALQACFEVLASHFTSIDAIGLVTVETKSGQLSVPVKWIKPEVETKLRQMLLELYGPVPHYTMPVDKNSYIQAIVREKKSYLYIPDTSKSKMWGDEIRAKHGIKSTFVLAIGPGELPSSVLLVVHSTMKNAFDADFISLFTSLEPIFAIGVKVWQREEELRKVNQQLRLKEETYCQQLELLYQMSRQLLSAYSLQSVFAVVFQVLSKAFYQDVAAILVVSGGRGKLIVQPTRPLLPAVQNKLIKRIIAAYERMTGTKLKDCDKKFLAPSGIQLPPARSVEFVLQSPLPRARNGGTSGVMLVGRERPPGFTREELRFFSTAVYLLSTVVPCHLYEREQVTTEPS